MKKLFTLLVALSAASLSMAYDFQATMDDGRILYFNVLSTNECEVSRMYYTERNASYVSGSLVVPSQVTDAEGTRYTVVGIGKSAFVHCRSLTSVTVPATVTYIGNAAFQKCRSLTSVNLPDGIKTIGDEAFEECSSLTELTLPRGVKSIGLEAFEDCDALKVLYVNSPEPPTVVSSTFPLDDNGKVPFALYVPYGTFSAYRNASYWNAFSDMREAGSNRQQNTTTGSRPTAGTASTPNTSDNRVNTAPAGNYSPNDYYDADDEINDLQRQIIELQQLNARYKDAIYKALFSSNLDECQRVLKEAVSRE
jgi:hypothetical protein